MLASPACEGRSALHQFAVTISCVALSALAVGCSTKGGARTIKLSHITSNTSHWHEGGVKFAELVKEKLGDRYEVKIFPGGQIANANQRTELQMLQSGTIEMQFVSPIILALFLDGRFDAFSAPWLFEDNAAARTACTGQLAGVAEEWLKEKGIVMLGTGINGFRQLTNSKKPVRSPADMAGVKFRVAGTELFLAVFKELGANALTMNFGEVFTSLQEGVIDGQENPLAIISTSRLYEAQTHLTLWNYAFDPIFLVANAEFWQTVPEADRRVLRACAHEAMAYQWDHAEKLERDILEDLTKKGMAVVTLSPDELAAFKSAAEPATRLLEKKVGAQILERFTDAAGASHAK
jgi:tripartite ATP-independent transporter DctP family solute receptor